MEVKQAFRLTSDDPRQRLRFRRYLIAAATSVMFVMLVALCYVRGLMALRPFVVASVSSLLGIGTFYALFRSRWNLEARDPSLTVPMMLWAVAMVTYVLYHAGPLSVCMIDVDLFKRVNDTLGHGAGDRVLQKLVETVQGEPRAIDFVGRYGGEEFLLVLTQTGIEGACECAERVRAQTERRTRETLGEPSGVTVSIGVAQYRPGEDVRATIARADAALYRAKKAGRNCVASES